MGNERTLYLKRSDTISRTLYNVVMTAYKPIVSVGITPCHVLKVVYTASYCFISQFFVLIISYKKSYRIIILGYGYGYLTFLTVFSLVAVTV